MIKVWQTQHALGRSALVFALPSHGSGLPYRRSIISRPSCLCSKSRFYGNHRDHFQEFIHLRFIRCCRFRMLRLLVV
jgi:hypothetical protein